MKVSKFLMINLIAGLSMGQLTEARPIREVPKAATLAVYRTDDQKPAIEKDRVDQRAESLTSMQELPFANGTRNQKSFKFSAEGNGELMTVSVIPYNNQDSEGLFLEGGAKVLKVKTAPHGTEGKPTVTFKVPAEFYDYNNKQKAQTQGFEVQVRVMVPDELGKKEEAMYLFNVDFESLKDGETACFTESDSLLWNAPATAQAICPSDNEEIINTLQDTINSHNETIKPLHEIINSNRA
ncbi:MAG: hypothetical protein NTZ68_00040 [Candidatus Dependentiae bacterium]|nr:hypothetical protein [Candidatus Dependentiae bacterium]